VRPIGEAKPRTVDVRVIAATSRDLEREVATGRFREDLFYRLDVFRVRVPPLRERREDVPLLVDHFINRFRETLGRPVRTIADDALDRMLEHAWPGNVRELENVIERAMILADGDRITLRELPEAIASRRAPAEPAATGAGDFSMRRARRRFESDLIRRALDATGGNRTRAAKLLEISYRALLYKIKEHGLGGDGEGAAE
jgi:two-component system, NtrC family, response regulator AtoC